MFITIDRLRLVKERCPSYSCKGCKHFLWITGWDCRWAKVVYLLGYPIESPYSWTEERMEGIIKLNALRRMGLFKLRKIEYPIKG